MLPPVIWTFWHDGRPPSLVADCLDLMRRMHPDLAVRLLTDDDLPSGRPDVRALRPQHRADWVRLCFLARHGGVWLDATVVTRAHVGCMCFDLSDNDTEFQGFTLGDPPAEKGAVPVPENWAFACPPGSQYLREWFAEFDGAVLGGLSTYRYNLPNVPLPFPGLPYLTMHATGVTAWAQRLATSGIPPRTRLRSATGAQAPFGLHAQLGWSVPRTVSCVLWERQQGVVPPVLKLRGWEAWVCRGARGAGFYDPQACVPQALGWSRPYRGWLLQGAAVLLVIWWNLLLPRHGPSA